MNNDDFKGIFAFISILCLIGAVVLGFIKKDPVALALVFGFILFGFTMEG